MTDRPKRIGRPPKSSYANAGKDSTAAASTSHPNSGTSTPSQSSNVNSHLNNQASSSSLTGHESGAGGAATPHSMMNHHRNPSSIATSNPSSKLLPHAWLFSTDSTPVRSNVPIGPGQAKYTTFASRMKAGTTGLMTPISGNEGDPKDPTGPRARDKAAEAARKEERYRAAERERLEASRAKTTTTASGRRINVNYNEDTNDDDLLEEKEATKKEIREANKAAAAAAAAANSTGSTNRVKDDLEPEIDWTYQYLGLPPPGNKIVVRPAQLTDHHYL